MNSNRSRASTSGLFVEDAGAGEPVLLLHSSGLSGRQWRRFAPEIVKRGLCAVTPDLTGHGRSEPWPEPKPFSFKTDVERVVALLGSLGAAHVVGHSYGGLLALHAAAVQPEAVRSLILYEPVTFGVLDAVKDADARATLKGVPMDWGVTGEDHEVWLRSFVEYWSGKGAWAALREEARTEFRRIGWVVREGVRTLGEDTTPASTFARVNAPTHLFTGEQSTIAGQRVVQRLGEAMQGARVTIIPEVGHMGPVTNGDVVHPLLLATLPRR
jgi:pimeloyl-ACP methyl ester carboxylesterase